MKKLWVGLLMVAALQAAVAQTNGSTSSNAPTSQEKARSKIDFDKIAAETNNPQRARSGGDVEVLSDTHGFDVSQYVGEVIKKIREHWYERVPKSAREPQLKQGSTIIAFVIQRDGSLAGLKLEDSSGDEELDRAAWAGITSSNKFKELPKKLDAPYLALRIKFLYNSDKKSK
jgi:TonB family protein